MKFDLPELNAKIVTVGVLKIGLMIWSNPLSMAKKCCSPIVLAERNNVYRFGDERWNG
jgi:hypothetical protein